MFGQEILLTTSNLKIAATSVVNNSDKEKYLYRGYGITFDSTGS